MPHLAWIIYATEKCLAPVVNQIAIPVMSSQYLSHYTNPSGQINESAYTKYIPASGI